MAHLEAAAEEKDGEREASLLIKVVRDAGTFRNISHRTTESRRDIFAAAATRLLPHLRERRVHRRRGGAAATSAVARRGVLVGEGEHASGSGEECAEGFGVADTKRESNALPRLQPGSREVDTTYTQR